MPLKTLRRAAKLTTLYNDQPDPPRLGDRAIIKREDTSKEITVTYPNQSVEEEIIWRFIKKKNEYWRQQSSFGNIKERGSTRVDFINDFFKAALFADGFYFHQYKSAWDEVKRSLVRKHGYRVYVWTYHSREELERNISAWYSRDFG